jgi:hypothetical protein
MSNSRVREALVASVAWTWPPVIFQMHQASIVPQSSSPRSARARAPATLSSSQAILVPEKYGSSSRPVTSVTRSSAPALISRSQAAAVRRSCQTMAGWIGSPVARSQMTTVSRWLVTPMAAMSATGRPDFSTASRRTATLASQISSASCSTQPSLG